jgi:hypothetical protein
MIPYLDIFQILKISMTSRKNNKFISEFINNHFINANAFNLTQDDIMFIPKFVEYLFDSSRIKECEHLNKLVKQVTQKHMIIYKFYKDPSTLVYNGARCCKLNHYATYMKFAMEHDPLLFQNGTKEFRYQDWWGRKALDADIRNYPYVSRSLRTNEYYAKRAVERDGLLLKHANKLRNNKEICLIAFEQNIESLEHIGRCVKLDKEFLKEIFYKKQNYFVDLLIKYFKATVLKSDKYCLFKNMNYMKMFKIIFDEYEFFEKNITINNKILVFIPFSKRKDFILKLAVDFPDEVDFFNKSRLVKNYFF